MGTGVSIPPVCRGFSGLVGEDESRGVVLSKIPSLSSRRTSEVFSAGSVDDRRRRRKVAAELRDLTRNDVKMSSQFHDGRIRR